jgi:hypothetical protein
VLDEIIKCIGQLSTIVTTTLLKTSYVQGIYVQGAGTQEKPYYAHSARVAGWSQVLDRWEKPGAFAVSDKDIIDKCRECDKDRDTTSTRPNSVYPHHFSSHKKVADQNFKTLP